MADRDRCCLRPLSSDVQLRPAFVKLTAPYYLPSDLEASVGTFVEHYHHRRYHESLANLTPADVYFGRDHAIIERRRKIKNLTIKKRRLAHHNHAA